MLPLALTLVLLAGLVAPAGAQSSRQIRVAVDFRQTSEQSRDAGLSSQRRVTRSSGIFTLVQDGGESTLTVATQVPYEQLVFYRDWATGAGHVTSGVTFRDVGTALRVQAGIVPGNRILVRITPRISYFSADGSGTIEVTEAATQIIVPNGRPVVLAGATSETHALLRQILGVRSERSTSETVVVLTATAQ